MNAGALENLTREIGLSYPPVNFAGYLACTRGVYTIPRPDQPLPRYYTDAAHQTTFVVDSVQYDASN
jgi:hypothetical protein